jgi:benzoyl-CoA reductase/2-hydroxyglutaryl-CoA dehydratase subunit BcrC/BadD/HgdB
VPVSPLTSSAVGLTSTVPVEILFASGARPVDLNNVFITSESPEELLAQAESAGFAHNVCAWIKGLYSVVMNHGIKTVLAVTGGDCSNTIALAEVLSHRGVRIVPFAYPLSMDRGFLMNQMEALRHEFHTTWSDIKRVKARLDRIRDKLAELDRLTFEKNVVSGFDNHLFLVSSSDFASDPDGFEKKLDLFMAEARGRTPMKEEIRLGYLGVPPIFPQIYDYIESLGARVVFNEVQRQFSMPFHEKDIVEQYLRYTYPYEVRGRIEDIRRAITERHLDGVIHYTQTFCHRQIYDILLRESLSVPILTLEGDRPGRIDSRTAVRVETFIEILRGRKSG